MLCFSVNNIITLLTECGSVIMSPVVCTNFNELAVTEMDTPVKDVNCLEEPLVPLRFHIRSYSTVTVQEYREMIAPSFPTKLYHFDEGIVFVSNICYNVTHAIRYGWDWGRVI